MQTERHQESVEDEMDLLETLSEVEIDEFCEANEPGEHYCPNTVHDIAWQNGINH